MQKSILLLYILFTCIAAKAQHRQQPDTTRLHWDNSIGSINGAKLQLTQAPVLKAANEEHRISPNQQFCFDVMMEVELNVGGTSLFTAVFINTTDGYVGYTKPTTGGAINILLPEIESFSFTIMSYKLGNVYMYHNRRASHGNGIDHLVTTSNTELRDYSATNNLTAAPLIRKNERRSYVYGTMNGQAYKRSDETTVWYINTADYRSVLPSTLQAQKFLGALGVGIVQTDYGPFILCERTNGHSYTRITNIERCHTCFDPTGFKLLEAGFYSKELENLRAESDKINREEAAIQHHTHCQTEELAVIAFRRENVKIQEENLRKAQQGNLMQDKSAQKAMLGAADPLISVRQSQLEAKVNICAIQHGLSEHPGDASLQNKLACAQQRLSTLQQAEASMSQIDRQYSNVVEAKMHKEQLLMELFKHSNCD